MSRKIGEPKNSETHLPAGTINIPLFYELFHKHGLEKKRVLVLLVTRPKSLVLLIDLVDAGLPHYY